MVAVIFTSPGATRCALISGSADAIGTLEIQGTKFVASFSPRSTVRPGDAIEIGVDTSRLYLFDPDTGAAIR